MSSVLEGKYQILDGFFFCQGFLGAWKLRSIPTYPHHCNIITGALVELCRLPCNKMNFCMPMCLCGSNMVCMPLSS